MEITSRIAAGFWWIAQIATGIAANYAPKETRSIPKLLQTPAKAVTPHFSVEQKKCSASKHVHVHVHSPSRQDAQPPAPWRHNVEGAEAKQASKVKVQVRTSKQAESPYLHRSAFSKA
jgi:hypothetical protein